MADFSKRELLFGITSIESYLDLSAQDLEFGFNETRRDRILRTYVRNVYHYHLNEIYSALKVRVLLLALYAIAPHVANKVQNEIEEGENEDLFRISTQYYIYLSMYVSVFFYVYFSAFIRCWFVFPPSGRLV